MEGVKVGFAFPTLPTVGRVPEFPDWPFHGFPDLHLQRLLIRGYHRVLAGFQDIGDNTQQFPADLNVPDSTSGNAPDPESRRVVRVRASDFRSVHLFPQVFPASRVRPGCNDV